MKTRNQLEASLRRWHLRLSVGYALIGIAYILTSDRLVHTIIPDPERIMHFEMVKGCTYVVVTAVLLYVALSAIRAQTVRIYDARMRVWNEHQKLLHELENRVQERTGDLEFVIQELESFTYSVSHDLRRPLRAMDSRRAELASHSLDPESQRVVLELGEQIKSMSEIVDDLLSLSRVGRDSLHRETVDLSAMCTRIINELRRRDPDRSVAVEIQPNLKVHADYSMINLAMINLIHNAWKFTSEVSQAAIWVTQDAEAVAVEDNGIGFDADRAEEMFKPFARLPGAQAFSGTGIGLAIVERIVRRHGGTINAEPRTGGGARFTFRLPANPGTEAGDRPV